jgi:hypothetical protein
MQRTRKTHQCQFEIQGNELERRAVPANMGNTFAIVSGEVVKAGELSQVKVNFDKNLFTLPKGKATIGVAVAPVSGGTVSPAISKVVNQANKSVAQASTPASRKISAAQSTTSTVPKPVIFNVQLGRGSAASTYTVSVKDQKTGTGNFLSGFYLPGDANGDLKVQKSDVDLIKGAIGAKTGDQKYNFNADSNRDGVIDNTDVKLAQQNMGVAVKVNPVITARLDPANDTGAADRITDQRNVIRSLSGWQTGITSSASRQLIHSGNPFPDSFRRSRIARIRPLHRPEPQADPFMIALGMKQEATNHGRHLIFFRFANFDNYRLTASDFLYPRKW